MDESKCNQILSKIAAGNIDAFRELYSGMSASIFSYALSIVRNRQLAEDVMQDVFVKIKLNADKYKDGKSPNGWVFKLTQNTAYDALKKQHHEVPVDISQEEIPDCDNESMENRLILKSALENLTKTERQIVMLYLAVGISQKEIAGILGLPVTAVNWKYRVGIKKLAFLLK